VPNAIVASGEVLVLVVGNVSGLAWVRTDSLGQKSIEFPLSQAPSAHGGVAIVPIRENVRPTPKSDAYLSKPKGIRIQSADLPSVWVHRCGSRPAICVIDT